MKTDSPLFSAAVDVEHAKELLNDALKRMEENEAGNAIVYVHSAMKELLRASSNLLDPVRREYHRNATKQEKKGA